MARSLLLHPIALVALIALAVNDHWLKAVAPGPVSGKLSDVAGLVLFPLLLAEVAMAIGRRAGWVPRSRVRVVAVAAGLTAAVFASVKVTAVGATAYAWGLGTIQWLLAGAWLRGEAPSPVAIVADPTDLLALPAVLVAVFVAALRAGTPASRPASDPQRARRLAGPAVALLAGVASIATSQAAPSARGSTAEDVTLDAQHPVATLQATWAIDLGGASSDQAWFEAWASMEDGRLPPGVEVILVPDQPPGEPVRTSVAARGLALPTCDGSCAGSATIVVRADREALGGDEPLVVTVQAYVSAPLRTESQAAATKATVVLTPIEGFAEAPTSIAAKVDGVVRASTNDPGGVPLELVLDADVLNPDRGWPLVGRLAVEVRTLGAPGNLPSFGARLDGLAADVRLDAGEPLVVDWLDSCPPAGECRIPLELVVSPGDGDDNEPVEVRVAWSVEASLEAFDGRSLPDGAIEIRQR